MLTRTANLEGFAIKATDGEIGTLNQFFFDDETWTIRYLVVETAWVGRHRVLISPFSIVNVDWNDTCVDVTLTKKQVENSPDIDTHQPISRRNEVGYLNYYGYPGYWGGPYLWGSANFPSAFEIPPPVIVESGKSPDSHLRSTTAVHGYGIESADGEIGHVDGFVMDDKTWTIRYLEVATRNWWPGKKVLIASDWIERVSWNDSNVYVSVSREAIKNAPEYLDSAPITREYESKLYLHYGRQYYWPRVAEQSPSTGRALVT